MVLRTMSALRRVLSEHINIDIQYAYDDVTE